MVKNIAVICYSKQQFLDYIDNLGSYAIFCEQGSVAVIFSPTSDVTDKYMFIFPNSEQLRGVALHEIRIHPDIDTSKYTEWYNRIIRPALMAGKVK